MQHCEQWEIFHLFVPSIHTEFGICISAIKWDPQLVKFHAIYIANKKAFKARC